MEKILEEIDSDIDICIYLKVKKSNLIDRLSGRRICSYDGCIYHVDFNPPEKEGICDQCGGVLHQREDDKEEVVKKRLKENENKTHKIKNYYQNKGILETVVGTEKSLNMVQEEINNIVKKYNIIATVPLNSCICF
jgi:adenylate kinase